jgi:hypothetical protein
MYDKRINQLHYKSDDNSPLATFVRYFKLVQANKISKAYSMTAKKQTLEALTTNANRLMTNWGDLDKVTLVAQVCLNSQHIFIWQLTKLDQQGKIQHQAISYTTVRLEDGNTYVDLVGDHASLTVHWVYYTTLKQPNFHNTVKKHKTMYQVMLNDSADIAAAGMTLHFNAKMIDLDIANKDNINNIKDPAVMYYAKSFELLMANDVEGFMSRLTPFGKKMLMRQFEHFPELKEAYIKGFRYRTIYVPFIIYNEHLTIISDVGSGGYSRKLGDFYQQYDANNIKDTEALDEGLEKYSFQHDYVLKDKQGNYVITNKRLSASFDEVLDDNGVFIGKWARQTVERQLLKK